MSQRTLIYADALQTNEDINRILQAFRGIQIDDRTPANAAANEPELPAPASPSRTIISISDSDSDSYWGYQSQPGATDAFWAPVSEPLPPDPAQDPDPVQDGSSLDVDTGERDYVVHGGLDTGFMESWHRAGHATQGVPGGKAVRRVKITPPTESRHKPRNAAWVVYEGLIPGIYETWPTAKAQTNLVSGNVHQGFTSRLAAEQAYILAYALGCVRSLPLKGSTDPPPAAAAPTPAAVLAAFAAVSEDFLGIEWHVVFKGRCPGVYPAWNFVASQTKGVSCAVYQKYPTRAAAQTAFRAAEVSGEVECLM